MYHTDVSKNPDIRKAERVVAAPIEDVPMAVPAPVDSEDQFVAERVAAAHAAEAFA